MAALTNVRLIVKDDLGVPNKTLQFHEIRCLEPTTATGAGTNVSATSSCTVSVSNRYGLTFIIINGFLHVLETRSLLVDTDLPAPVKANVSNIGLSADESLLAVATGSTVLVYETTSFALQPDGAQPRCNFVVSKTGAETKQLAWNPAEPKLIAALGNDGSLIIIKILNNWSIEANSHTDNSFKCMSWSPKGKQLAVGGSKSIIQLKTDMKKAKEVALVPNLAVMSMFWLSNTQFLLGTLGSNQGQPEMKIMLLTLDKTEAVYRDYGDIFLSEDYDNPAVVSKAIHEWKLHVLGSSTSSDIIVVAYDHGAANADVILQEIEDRYRAAAPLDHFCRGLGLYLGNQEPVTINGEELHSTPILIVITQKGLIKLYKILNDGAESVYKPTPEPVKIRQTSAAPLITASATAPVSVTPFAGPGAPSKSPFTAPAVSSTLPFSTPAATSGFSFGQSTAASQIASPSLPSFNFGKVMGQATPPSLFGSSPLTTGTQPLQPSQVAPVIGSSPISFGKVGEPVKFAGIGGSGNAAQSILAPQVKAPTTPVSTEQRSMTAPASANQALGKRSTDGAAAEKRSYDPREAQQKQNIMIIKEALKQFNEKLKEHKVTNSRPLASQADAAEIGIWLNEALHRDQRNLIDFAKDIQETTDGQVEEVDILQLTMQRLFARIEHACISAVKTNDSYYLSLHKSLPLDSASAEKFSQVERMHTDIGNRLKECVRHYSANEKRMCPLDRAASSEIIRRAIESHSMVIQNLKKKIAAQRQRVVIIHNSNFSNLPPDAIVTLDDLVSGISLLKLKPEVKSHSAEDARTTPRSRNETTYNRAKVNVLRNWAGNPVVTRIKVSRGIDPYLRYPQATKIRPAEDIPDTSAVVANIPQTVGPASTTAAVKSVVPQTPVQKIGFGESKLLASPAVNIAKTEQSVISSVASSTTNSGNALFGGVSFNFGTPASSPAGSKPTSTSYGGITATTSMFSASSDAKQIPLSKPSISNLVSGTPPPGATQPSVVPAVVSPFTSTVSSSSSLFGSSSGSSLVQGLLPSAVSSTISGASAVATSSPAITSIKFGSPGTSSFSSPLFGSVKSIVDAPATTPSPLISFSTPVTKATSLFGASGSFMGIATPSSSTLDLTPATTSSKPAITSNVVTSIVSELSEKPTPSSIFSLNLGKSENNAGPTTSSVGLASSPSSFSFGTSAVSATSATTSSSLFGLPKPATSTSSIFGALPTTTSSSLFGSISSGHILGTTAAATSVSGATATVAPLISSTSTAAVSTASIPSEAASVVTTVAPQISFGTPASAPSASVFGSGARSEPASTSIAGFTFSPSSSVTITPITAAAISTPSSTATPAVGSIFGSVTVTSAPGSASLFGSTATTTTSSSIFGAGSLLSSLTTSPPTTSASATTAASSSIFGATISSTVTAASATASPTPGVFNLSSVSAASPAPSPSIFSPLPSTTSSSLFGSSQGQSNVSAFGTAVSTPASTTQSLFASVSTPAFGSAFGSTSSGQEVKSPLFGSSAATAANPVAGFGSLSFGGGDNAATQPKSGGLFGSSPFGVSATTENKGDGKPPSGLFSSVFGGSGAATQAEGNTSSIFGGGAVFGGGSTFGASALKPSPLTSTTKIFGGGPEPGNTFGSMTQEAPKQASVFGGAAFGSSAFGTASQQPSAFGAGTNPTQQSPFGVAASSPQQTSVFGQGSTSPQQSAFGGATPLPQQSAFGGSVASPSKPVFGGAASPSPAFGSAPVFGGTPAFGGGAVFGGMSAFGSTNKPVGSGSIFGGGATQAVGFGGLAAGSPTGGSVFGGGNQQQQPAFGSFGSSFGGDASQSQAGFGAPSFGSFSQPQQQKPAQQQPASFGGSSFSSWR